MSSSETLLSIRDVSVSYPGKGWRAKPTEVLSGVSLDVHAHETVGLVGESGSGKTTLGRAVLGLAPVTAGSIKLKGREVVGAGRAMRRSLASELQVVFQDPYSSLNPTMTVEDILAEPLLANGIKGGRTIVRDLLDKVHLPADSGRRLAREFSGGQRQRIAIARALALSPSVIILDEPTSALDLSTQARIVDLLIEIQERTGVGFLFITHDLSVVRAMSHRIAVMLQGRIVEVGTADQISDSPEHPYTQRLQMAAPIAHPAEQRKRREERRIMLTQQKEQNLLQTGTIPSGATR